MSLLLLMGDSTPSIGSLFANNEAGLALDVETAYRRGWVYQDSAGATVAAAPGDPVGLILDTAKGGLDSLGSELWTNPTPTLADNAGSAAAYDSGTRTMTNGGSTATGYPRFSFNLGLTSGRFYKIDGVITGNTASLSTVRLALSGSANNVTYNSTTGVISGFALAGSASLEFVTNLTSGQSLVISSLSIREIPGNHAYQTTSGSRPALARTPDGGRRNLLVYSETLSNAAWSAFNVVNGSSVNGVVSVSDAEGFAYVRQLITASTSTDHAISFDVTCDQTISNVPIRVSGTTGVSTLANLTAGVTTRITLTGYRPNASDIQIGLDARNAVVPGGSNSTGYNVTFNRAQLETGSSATAYQKVGLTSDVTESGKRDCWGLLFDGSDDSLQTASVDFSAGDKMTVMAGVRKLSDAGNIPIELGTNVGTSNGSFAIYGGINTTASGAYFAFISRGSSTIHINSAASFASPVTAVLTGTSVISTDSLAFRINGTQVGTSTDDQGSGNYGNYALYIGARGGSSFRFNGILYTLIVRGATTPTGTIADFERNLLAKRAGTSW